MSGPLRTTHTWETEDSGWGHWTVRHVTAGGDVVSTGASFLEEEKDSDSTVRLRGLLDGQLRAAIESGDLTGMWVNDVLQEAT